MFRKLFLRMCVDERNYSIFDYGSFRHLFLFPEVAEVAYQCLVKKYPKEDDLKDAILECFHYRDVTIFVTGEIDYDLLERYFREKDLKYGILCLIEEKETVSMGDILFLFSKYRFEK